LSCQKLNRTVTPRDDNPSSDVRSEIPYKVIREAIVNAVAHRDYSSNASVQVFRSYSDRVESATREVCPQAGLLIDCRQPAHIGFPGILHHQALFLTHYAEQAGTGTLDMITLSRKAGIPDPDFEQQGDESLSRSGAHGSQMRSCWI